MAKFIINRNAVNQQNVDAESFKLRDGFFWFSDSLSSNGKTVFVQKADAVYTIEREG